MAIRPTLSAGMKSDDEGFLRVRTDPVSSPGALSSAAGHPGVSLGQSEDDLLTPPGALQAVLFQCALGNVDGENETARQINQLACIAVEIDSMVSEMKQLFAEEKAFTEAIPTSGPLGNTLADLQRVQRKLVAFYDKALKQWDRLIPAMRDHVAELQGTVEDFLDVLDEPGARDITNLDDIREEAAARAADTYIPLADRALYELSHLRVMRNERQEVTATLFEAGASFGGRAQSALNGWKTALDSWRADIGDDQGGILGSVLRKLIGKNPFEKILIGGGLLLGGAIVFNRLMR